jgi:prepilin-type N-terminal cleavage/methylation domain-containing protein
MKSTRSAGFTLIELIITVAIAVMMMAVAMPLFSNIMAQRRLNSAAERVVSDLRFAQSQAVTQGGLFRLHHGDDSGQTGKYRIEQSVDGGATWSQVTGWYDLSSDYQGSSLQVVKDNDGAGVVRYFVRFNAQGAADNTGYAYPIRLTVITPSGTTRSIQVMRTGVVRLM